MRTSIGSSTEWTAAPLRMVARWVPVCGPDGRARMEMRWSAPAIEVPQEAPGAATGTTAAA